MTKQHLRVFRHYSPGEGITLVGSQIMTFPPSAAHKFFKVIARVKLFVLGREVVENLGSRMDTGRSHA